MFVYVVVIVTDIVLTVIEVVVSILEFPFQYFIHFLFVNDILLFFFRVLIGQNDLYDFHAVVFDLFKPTFSLLVSLASVLVFLLDDLVAVFELIFLEIVVKVRQKM